MKRPEIISYSQLMTFLSCRYRWDLTYNRGLRTRKDHRAPTLGSAGHIGIAAVMKGQDPTAAIEEWKQDYLANNVLGIVGSDEIDALNVEITEMANEVAATAINIVDRFFDRFFFLSDWEVVEYKGEPMIERELQVPIRGWSGYRAFIDYVGTHKPTGQTWLIDWKFRKQFTPMESEEVNLQNASYQYLLQRHGIKTVGSISGQILAKLPSWPTLNKNGTMSRAKIASDWLTYESALLEAGLNPDDYRDEMEDKLDTEWIRFNRAFRSPEEVKYTWKNVIQAAAWDMARSRMQITRNMGYMNCNTCWSRDFCLEELRDPERALQLIGNTYLWKEESSPEEGEEE